MTPLLFKGGESFDLQYIITFSSSLRRSTTPKAWGGGGLIQPQIKNKKGGVYSLPEKYLECL
jgi:hypothetical protein